MIHLESVIHLDRLGAILPRLRFSNILAFIIFLSIFCFQLWGLNIFWVYTIHHGIFESFFLIFLADRGSLGPLFFLELCL